MLRRKTKLRRRQFVQRPERAGEMHLYRLNIFRCECPVRVGADWCRPVRRTSDAATVVNDNVRYPIVRVRGAGDGGVCLH